MKILELKTFLYNHLPAAYKKSIIYYYNLAVYFPKNVLADVRRIFFKEKVVSSINRYEKRIYSQNGEDGIIQIIFEKIKTTNRFCVEFGIFDNEGNTVFLKNKGWKTLWMDMCGDGQIIKKELITAENINKLFLKYRVPKKFDLLSIDIDFNDYWIWKVIRDYEPRVVIIEYNSAIAPSESRVVKYDPKAMWDKTNYAGASLKALDSLGKTKGYTLIGCESNGINAFFVRSDLVPGNFEVKKVEELYQKPHYGQKVDGQYIGHIPSKRVMRKI